MRVSLARQGAEGQRNREEKKREMGDMAGKDSEVMVKTKSGALCLRDCIKPTSIH